MNGATMPYQPFDNYRRMLCLVKSRKNAFLRATNVPLPVSSAPVPVSRRTTLKQWFAASRWTWRAPMYAASIARGDDHLMTVCTLCAQVCQACGAECGKHAMAHCQRCAEACQRCADACTSMTR
ncbi:four-helix bundle copper-binding protein [Rhodoferax ferrireducens]|uniref:four-helix bundle copper-binding protein n=1 Tax=Rhodoferax ferrireducens TaxID=192843 RepID=UPI00384CEC81